MKYSDFFCKTLKEMGYTHCFTLQGGNIMHLINSANHYFTVVPVVNEVAAGIAVEYFNECQSEKKAFALVTAGPGLTNIVTAMAGAFLEGRDLLVVGGQVKTADLSRGTVRQNGIQEIDGVALVKSITKVAKCLEKPASQMEISSYVNAGLSPKKAPVFIEIPLDIQAQNVDENRLSDGLSALELPTTPTIEEIQNVVNIIRNAKRPIFLLGGGLSRNVVEKCYNLFEKAGIPLQTTWNGADRIGSEYLLYFGRPNTWGQRYANILMQQADCLIAIGTRLGLQQTGFNWQQFVPHGKVVQIECDEAELNKGHPNVYIKLQCDANSFLEKILKYDFGNYKEWIDFCSFVKSQLSLVEENICDKTKYISSYDFNIELSNITKNDDVIIPCSSGGAVTCFYQTFYNKKNQVIIGNKSLASMGYGLSGAIGCSFAFPKRRVILTEGDGGFSQNLQELGTVVANSLNIKIFIFENQGYASIRMTQKSYFHGKYLGCDINTGLGFPNWNKLFDAYSIPVFEISSVQFAQDEKFQVLFSSDAPAAFIVHLDPEQTYFPKIMSKITESGTMESNPLHLMSPDLSTEVQGRVIEYI